MVIVARVTQDAVVKTLKDERKLVVFSVVINDFRKPHGTDKVEKTSLFIQCAYWVNTTVSTYLTKGTVVELNGRLYLNAYKNMQGEAQAGLNCHVNEIKLHGGGKAKGQAEVPAQQPTPADFDLPF